MKALRYVLETVFMVVPLRERLPLRGCCVSLLGMTDAAQALWKGNLTGLVQVGAYGAIQFLCYDVSKRALSKRYNLPDTSPTISFASGWVHGC